MEKSRYSMLARKLTRIVRFAISTICQSVSRRHGSLLADYLPILRDSRVSRQRISLNCLTIRFSMIIALCQAIIHQRQPTRSTGVDQFSHPKSSTDYISASSTSSYAHSQDFTMYPLSILHPFDFSIHARASNRKPPLDGRHLCSYQPTTHSPTYDRNVSQEVKREVK